MSRRFIWRDVIREHRPLTAEDVGELSDRPALHLTDRTYQRIRTIANRRRIPMRRVIDLLLADLPRVP